MAANTPKSRRVCAGRIYKRQLRNMELIPIAKGRKHRSRRKKDQTKTGMLLVKVTDGESSWKNWKRLHRYPFMEQQVGRPLLKEETVHHINGVRG